jgi:hypothetical protein
MKYFVPELSKMIFQYLLAKANKNAASLSYGFHLHINSTFKYTGIKKAE